MKRQPGIQKQTETTPFGHSNMSFPQHLSYPVDFISIWFVFRAGEKAWSVKHLQLRYEDLSSRPNTHIKI